MNPIIEAALIHQHEGHSVIAVDRNKKPYHEGWNQYFTHHQTEEEVRHEFSNGADGIALILYPSCQYVVLDYDGPHADDAWEKTNIELPDTALNKTRSGGKHLYFRMPAGPLPIMRRKVRLIKADCSCKKTCGVDLLIHGYALIPPSPGYSEDPDHPLESAALIPQVILNLIAERRRDERRAMDDTKKRISHGERKATLCSLAGTMRSRGMSIESIRAALNTDNEQRFDPPLDEREIEDVLRSAQKWGTPDALENLTDLGNAKRFETVHAGNVFYCAVRKKWILWNGHHWQWDMTGEILDYAQTTLKILYAEASMQDDEKLRKTIAQHALKSESRGKLEAMTVLAQSLPKVRTNLDRFDCHPMLLNTPNATIDLRTGLMRKSAQEDYITRAISTEYDPSAQCPLFLDFIDTISLHRPELAAFIQRAAGYSLTADISEQCIFILYGAGSNGKSTMVNVFREILGKDYAQEIKTEIFMDSKTDNTAEYHLAELSGKRFVAMSETSKRKSLKIALIKQVTGGEPIPARRPYELPFEFNPNFKLWLSTNHKPSIPDNNDAIWRRIHMIPFDMKFPDDTRIKRYEDILLAEASGILNWLIAGCLDWQKNGLNPPEIIKEQNREYRAQEDIIGNYIENCLVKDPNAVTTFASLYSDYKKYCEKNGEHYESSRTFGSYLTEHGFAADHGPKNVSIRLGLSIQYENACD